MNSSSLTDQQVADLLDAARAELAADVFADHPFGAPAHVETYRAYSIGVWELRGGFYAELDNGNGDNGAAQGLYEDIASAVDECQRMIDYPYD